MKPKNQLLGLAIKAIMDDCYRQNIPLEIFAAPHPKRSVPDNFKDQQLCLRVHQASVPSYRFNTYDVELMMIFGGRPFTIVLPYDCFTSIKVPDLDFSLPLNSPVDALHEFIEGVVRGAIQEKSSHKNINFELLMPVSDAPLPEEGTEAQVPPEVMEEAPKEQMEKPKRRRKLVTAKKQVDSPFDIIPPKK